MKKFRKLIPALCMLLVSALFVGTSTYAWFSMNTQVTATDMKVTAKSDSIYLLISKDKTTADGIQGDKLTTVAINNDKTELMPSALATAATKEGVKVTSIDNYDTTSNWYTAYALKEDASTVKMNTEKNLATEGLNFADYVQTYTYTFTLAKGSNAAKDLTVSKCEMTAGTDKGTNTITPVRVLLVCGNNVVEFDSTGATVDADASKILAASVTDSSVVTVKAYVYYNGNDAAVYTNNVANLAGASINLTFDVTAQ